MSILTFSMQLVKANSKSKETEFRWRNNDYIRENGILPYQNCNASDHSVSVSPIKFLLDKTWDIFILASSVWGKSDISGEPKEISKIEILLYGKHFNKSCDECCGGFSHCVFGYGSVSDSALVKLLESVKIECSSVSNIKFQNGIFKVIKQPDKIGDPRQLPGIVAVTIECPVQTIDMDQFLKQDTKFSISLKFSNSNFTSNVIKIPLCYDHVHKADDIVIITEPFYGINNMEDRSMRKFWHGEPKYEGYNLFDQFIIYYSKIVRAGILINDVRNDMESHLQKYKGIKNIRYRKNWGNMLKIEGSDEFNSWEIELIADTTGMWEQRFRAKYFICAHSADEYVQVTIDNKTIADVVRQINSSLISAMEIPVVTSTFKRPMNQKLNVLQRWNKRFGSVPDQLQLTDSHHTPMGNPRHITYYFVHWINGPNEHFQKYVNYTETPSYHVNVLHLMGLTRDKKALGNTYFSYVNLMANRLQRELVDFKLTNEYQEV